MTPAGPKHAETAARAVNDRTLGASDERAQSASRDEDFSLVQRAQQGSHAAFRLLFDKYNRRTYAIALGVVKNPHDARDVVQEAFIKVHRHLPNFQGASSFYTWLYRITMNLAIDHLRRRKTARQVDYDDTRGPGDHDVEDPGHLTPMLTGADPAKVVSRKELTRKIQDALDTLPEYHRQVILLREVEGLSYEEISKVMKVPKGTIMSRLFHARRKMQSALAEYVDGDLKSQTEEEHGDSTR